jgi:UDP-N-acetylglucosamine 4,6-dehydratase
MTRFWISLEHAVEVVVKAISHMQGGEIFVPKIPSMKILDLAEAIAPDCKIEIIGIRPGEKLHEILITEEDGRSTVEYDGLYVILPQFSWWHRKNYKEANPLPEGFSYTSNNNDRWLTQNQLKSMTQEFSSLLRQAGSKNLSKVVAPYKESGIHKAKYKIIAPANNIGHGNNIPT